MYGRVFINGKDTGMIESHREWADEYWRERARRTGLRIVLKWSEINTWA
jgi:hypothetical protein